MYRLKDKVAIVTGAAGAIGLSIGKTFAHNGANVVLTDLQIEETSRLAEEIAKQGSRTIALRHDVSSETGWKRVIEQTLQRFGHLHILVNNAGVGGKEGIENTTLEQWEKVQKINVNSHFLGMKYSVPEMRKEGGGSIINISSIYGLIGNGEASAYHASKSAVRGLTKTVAVELAKYNIRVNSIHPGVVETPMIKRKLENERIKTQLHELTPWQRFGKPLDIAYGALYLASDESSFVTGSELVIDGGYTAQ